MFSRTRLSAVNNGFKYVLVAIVSALAAMALAAPAVNARNDGFESRILACFESRNADSEYCRLALEQSPVDHAFFWRLGDNLLNPLPAPEPEVDVKTLVKECAATQDLKSDECRRAIEASGLSLEEFKAEWAYKLGKMSKTYKPEESATMKECMDLKAKLKAGAVHDYAALVDKINYVCVKALKESHLSPSQFWSKYR